MRISSKCLILLLLFSFRCNRVKVIAVSAFAGKEKLTFKQVPGGVTVFLDTVKMNDTDTVIQLELKK